MQLQQNSPDAVASFSDFLLERFGLVASMQVWLVVSIAVHATAILGLGIQVVDWRKIAAPHNVMDVVLVNAKTAAKPVKADALAQANLEGGGNTDAKARAQSPFPNLQQQRQQTQELQARMRQLERETQQLLTQMQSKAKVTQTQAAPEDAAKPDSDAKALVERTLEIEQLQAQIARQHKAYQERPRKTFIGARTQEYRFAQYIDSWRQRVERVGNLNYPEEARRRRIHGQLRLTVGIKANGEVESIEVNQTSTSKILDEAAKRIVRLSAPFERLPENIRKDTDILYITRTWHFTREDLVYAE